MNNAIRVVLVKIVAVIILPLIWYVRDEQWRNDKKDFEQSVFIDISML